MSTKIYDMRDEWTAPLTQYTSIQMNAIDKSSDVNSRLLDLKRNGVSQFTIDKFGELVTGTLDIPRVNNLEDIITTLSGVGLAKVDVIAPTRAALDNITSPAPNAVGLVYNDPGQANNDWYYKTGAIGVPGWANTGLLPALANQLTPRKPVQRTFYVTEGGNDNDANAYINQTSNTGMSIYKPFGSIPAALQAAAATQEPCIVIVHPGEYEVPAETEIPTGVLLYGYDARVTKLSLATITDEFDKPIANNMFLLTSGCKVRGFSFTNLFHESSWQTDPGGNAPEANAPGSLDYGPPKKGYAFAFKPGAIITRSPYISDCCVIHSLTQQELSLPMNRATGNPLVPMTGGNLYADGAVLDADSPLRSVVVDSFTAVNPNGVGYAIVNSGFVQLVSVFTNWSRVGIWAHAGGQVTVVNSNATFGDYAFASTGFRYVVRVDGIEPNLLVPNVLFGEYVRDNVDDIVNYLMSNNSGYKSLDVSLGNNAFTNTILANSVIANLTSRDTKTILLETADDIIAGQDKGTIFWIQSSFKSVANTDPSYQFRADSVFTFNANTYLELYKGTWRTIKDYLKSLTVSNGGNAAANAMIEALFNLANTVVSNPIPYTQTFQSKIEAASHQFSYAGSGVNYNAIPFGQRSSGEATDPTTNLYTSNGGIIYATFNTEQGDTYLGSDLKVDFERNTIEGQAFSRGVQNITLPLIIGVGG